MAIFMHRHLYLIAILLCLSLLLLQTTCRTLPIQKGGFSLKLIHRFQSPESPFYNPNISTNELRNRQFKSDEIRLQYLHSIATNHSDHKETNYTYTEIMRPPYYEFEFTYSVALSIGQGILGRKNFRLHLDTGSGLTWVQCRPCYPSFYTMDPLFEPTQSTTYRSMPCNDIVFPPPNYRCVNEIVQFRYPYADNTYVSGEVAFEKFSFDSSEGPNVVKQYSNVVFGCAHSVSARYPFSGPEGILGMSLDQISFIQQIALDREIGSRFSYCFADAGSPRHGYLRFGNDIPELPQQTSKHTPIISYRGPPHLYYLKLNGISIGITWIEQILPSWFIRRSDGTGGTTIDSGSSHSRLTTRAFEVRVQL